MANRRTDYWSETYCDRRFHPDYLTRGPGLPYWFFCRRERGHQGNCDCEAAHEAADEAGLAHPPAAPDTWG